MGDARNSLWSFSDRIRRSGSENLRVDRSGGGANVGVSGTGRGFCGGGGFLRGTRVGIAFLWAALLARASRSGSEDSVVVEGIDDGDFFAESAGRGHPCCDSQGAIANASHGSPYLSPSSLSLRMPHKVRTRVTQ